MHLYIVKLKLIVLFYSDQDDIKMSTEVKRNEEQSSLHLPKLKHSVLRVQDNSSNNVSSRAGSRASSLGGLADKYISVRQQVPTSEKMPTRPLKFDNKIESQFQTKLSDFNFPESVNIVYASDINKISLPLFGKIFN
jgi:hypothetical protein